MGTGCFRAFCENEELAFDGSQDQAEQWVKDHLAKHPDHRADCEWYPGRAFMDDPA